MLRIKTKYSIRNSSNGVTIYDSSGLPTAPTVRSASLFIPINSRQIIVSCVGRWVYVDNCSIMTSEARYNVTNFTIFVVLALLVLSGSCPLFLYFRQDKKQSAGCGRRTRKTVVVAETNKVQTVYFFLPCFSYIEARQVKDDKISALKDSTLIVSSPLLPEDFYCFYPTSELFCKTCHQLFKENSRKIEQ